MSYDIWLVPAEGSELDDADELDWNYTYNIQPMTAKAGLPSLTLLDGVPACVAALALDEVIDRMLAERVAYRALNPKNGWGDYDGFLARLLDLRDHFRRVPTATVRVG